MLLSVFACLVSCFCRSQTHNLLCSDGYDKFEAKFTTGVTVSVGAARNGKLARQTCEATLRWDKQDLVVVPEAAQADVDVLGVDLGLGVPVVAFQTKARVVCRKKPFAHPRLGCAVPSVNPRG
jgi:hypothetical protein